MKLLLLLGLMFRCQTLLNLSLNFRILFRFSLLLLAGNKSGDRNYGWDYKELSHGDELDTFPFSLFNGWAPGMALHFERRPV